MKVALWLSFYPVIILPAITQMQSSQNLISVLWACKNSLSFICFASFSAFSYWCFVDLIVVVFLYRRLF